MIRTSHGQWVPTAFFYTKFGDGDIIRECLKSLKAWCLTGEPQKRWKMRYAITDDSGAEYNGITGAFQGLIAGETEPSVLLCKKHCGETLRRRFKGQQYEKTLRHMMVALWNRKTRPGCEQSLQSAIDALPKDHFGLPDQVQSKYIENEWWKTLDRVSKGKTPSSCVLLTM
jgi:hypothetical protein